MESSELQDGEPSVRHDGLTILLGASRFDPGHINPDFLRYNEIVNTDWQVERPVILESGFSQVDYANGLSVSAGETFFRVAQFGRSLDLAEIAVSDVVSRYLEVAPWTVEYNVILIDLIGAVPGIGKIDDQNSLSLRSLAQMMDFEGVTPDTQMRMSYSFPEKSITMYASEFTEDNSTTEIRFRTQIQRDMESVSVDEQSDFIVSVLEKLEDDIRVFVELAHNFYFRFIQEEG